MTAIIILPQAVYRRTKEPHELRSDLRLRAMEWALYFAVTGKHTAAELGRQLRADAAERDEALARLASLGLICEHELSASEYVRALAAAGDREEKTLHEFLLAASAPALEVKEATADPVALQPRPRPREVRIAPPAFGFQPLPSPDANIKEQRPMAGSRNLSLRALMNVIEKQAGTREAGQLDIYRVFVRVDTVLLKRNGIETLRFTEDRLVSDPDLQQAIVRSVKKTLGFDCPQSVWVNVA